MTALNDDPLHGNDKYRAISMLGKGGMGEVYLAEHLTLGNRVVIKLLHAHLADKPGLVDRMRLEAQALARLEHPNLVRVNDFDKTEAGRPYFVMEHLQGCSLSEFLAQKGGCLLVKDALEIVQQALAGLAVAHGAGLVHRDIKLDNLFVCEPTSLMATTDSIGTVKILDFGVAKVLGGASDAPAPLQIPTSTGVVVGTPRFLAPEQARGQALDHRADIYAIGLVLYTLISGRGPFEHATNISDMARAHVFAQPEAPSRYAQQTIVPRLDAAILRCLAKNPDDRFQTASDLSQELKQIAELKAPVTHADSAPRWLATEFMAQENEVSPRPPTPQTPPAADAPPTAPHDRTTSNAYAAPAPSAHPQPDPKLYSPAQSPIGAKPEPAAGYSTGFLLLVVFAAILLGGALLILQRML